MKCFITLFLLATIVSGCAISRSVSYSDLNLSVPSVKAKNISIAVWDQREQVISGNRKPNFVGYTRSGAGIAYPMGTESGKAFADDIALDISSSYQKNGTNANMIPTSFKESEKSILSKLKDRNSDKLILMKMNELHTDGYMGFDLFYDLQSSVYKSSGELLEQISFTGTMPLGKVKHYKTNLPNGLQELLEQIFNDPEILEALNYFDSKQDPYESTFESNPKPNITVNQSLNATSNEFDVIYLNSGSEIKAKVVEITVETIKYKNFDQLDGPIRNIPLEDVFMIIYQNGSREILKK